MQAKQNLSTSTFKPEKHWMSKVT